MQQESGALCTGWRYILMNKLILKQLTPFKWEGTLVTERPFDYPMSKSVVDKQQGTRLELEMLAHETFGCNNFVTEEIDGD